MDPDKEIARLLALHGFVLRRKHKHRIWQNQQGKVFQMSRTPGDWRASFNALRDLRVLLGVQSQHAPGERRPKKASAARVKASLDRLPGSEVRVRTWKGQLAELLSRWRHK